MGAKPLMPIVERIAAVANRRELERQIAELHQGAGVFVPGAVEPVSPAFRLGAAEDPDNPNQVTARIVPAALGLPDRDYYLKDDAKSLAMRRRYLQHIERLLGFAGFATSRAERTAATVLAMETEFARHRLSRVEVAILM